MDLSNSLIANVDLILSGMFKDQVGQSKDLNKKQDAFAKMMYDDLRTAYDAYMPNIHILDADNVAALVVAGIISDPESIISIADPSYKDSVVELLRKKAPKLRNGIREGIASMHKKFLSRATGHNPVRLLNAKLGMYIRIKTRNNSILSKEDYIDIGSQFNSYINSIFPKNVALLGVSAESVGVVDRPHRYVFFQKSFLSGKDTINKNITSYLIKELKEVEKDIRGNIKDVGSITGKFVDFGHVGTRESGSKTLNINTPALTKIIYNVINLSSEELRLDRRDPNAARAVFINKTGHISNSIEITKKFNKQTGFLVSIGMTTTTDMESEYNRHILGQKESRQLDRSTKDRFNSTELVRSAMYKRLSDTFMGSSILKLFTGKSSYSFKEYLELLLKNTLSGNQTKNYYQKTKKQNKNTVTQKILAGIGDIKISPTKQPKTYNNSRGLPALRDLGGRFYSLTSLENLLNANLVQQVKQNMGDGSRRDILNLRSGRFAESVKVERLSQSREGMISVFYSYMKHPYATFSRGGQQERPYTRDPKLLIAKSIREIASQQVANRLRAVNV